MNEDYLWDRSGVPDPEIHELERTLAPLRYRLREPAGRKKRWPAPWLAVAAAIVAAIALGELPRPLPRATAWRQGATALTAGQVVRTGAAETTLQSADVGRVELGPDSELRVTGRSNLLLRRGTLHAFIWAPPREFVVDTPSARAVDLGCAYTLQVDPSGDGLLRVEFGWVAFQFEGRESFIPAGAECVTRRRRGPGVPFYEDAPLRAELAAFEAGDSAALAGILREARPRDGLTLWHLLMRVPVEQRAAVLQRFRELVPVQVDADAVLRGEAHALDACWNALNLENTGWWRGWERAWK
jgi:hypothetical protein